MSKPSLLSWLDEHHWRREYALCFMRLGASKQEAEAVARVAEYNSDIDPEDAARDEASYMVQDS